MSFLLPKHIEYVLATLLNNGHSAYIVGGCVRDLLRGNIPHDYDITTSALPQEVQALFNKTIATGLKHGTVTVVIDNYPIEVTTFRTESAYNDSRHPQTVNFVCDVKEDLARRDFTVNAICYNKHTGLIDLFGGVDDINNKTLRAVGNAKMRFCEDALRVLRLFRFAATLGFNIEKTTFNAAIECAPLLANISAERIFTELQKSASGDNIAILSNLLKTNALFSYSLTNADLTRLSRLEKKQKLRTFALLNLASCNLQNTLNSFKCSNSFKDYCSKMHYLSQNIMSPDKISIKTALSYADYEIVFDSLLFYQDILNIDVSHHKLLLKEVISHAEPYKISHLDISGNDITALGINGKEIKEKLNFLLEQVVRNPSLNTKEKLLNLICN